MYYKLPVKERIELMKSYKKANPDMSYQDMVNDYNNSYKKFGDGGKSNGMTGMMKAKIATEAHYGNPAALRMVSPNPKTGMTPEGIGTHYMTSMGEYAVPLLQDFGNKNLKLVNGMTPSSEDFKFSRPEDAEYFAEYYKEVAPMMRSYEKFGDGGKKQQTRTDIYTDKALFDKAYKAEMDSINVRKKSDQTFKPGSKIRLLTKEEKEFWKDEQTGLYPNVVEYNPNHPGAGYFGHFKKPVVHNIYQEPEKEPKPFVKKWTDKVAYDQAVKAEMDSANRYNEYINKVKQYQKEGLELKRASFVDKATLNFMNDPAFANSIYSKPIREEYYGNPTKSGNVTSQATALVYKKPVVHNVYEPVMTKPIQSSQDTVRHWNFNGPNPVLEYYDKSGKLINKEFYTNAGPGGKRIQPLNK